MSKLVPKHSDTPSISDCLLPANMPTGFIPEEPGDLMRLGGEELRYATGLIQGNEKISYPIIVDVNGIWNILRINWKYVTFITGELETFLGTVTRFRLEDGSIVLVPTDSTEPIKFLGKRVISSGNIIETVIWMVMEFELENGSSIFLLENQTDPLEFIGKSVVGAWQNWETCKWKVSLFELEWGGAVLIPEGGSEPLKIDNVNAINYGKTEDTCLGKISTFFLEDSRWVCVLEGNSNSLKIAGKCVRSIRKSYNTVFGKVTGFELNDTTIVFVTKDAPDIPLSLDRKKIAEIGDDGGSEGPLWFTSTFVLEWEYENTLVLEGEREIFRVDGVPVRLVCQKWDLPAFGAIVQILTRSNEFLWVSRDTLETLQVDGRRVNSFESSPSILGELLRFSLEDEKSVLVPKWQKEPLQINGRKAVKISRNVGNATSFEMEDGSIEVIFTTPSSSETGIIAGKVANSLREIVPTEQK